MNIFNVRAANAGKAFIHAHPNASSIQIDNAAPKFNPARRYFINAAHDRKAELAVLNTKETYLND